MKWLICAVFFVVACGGDSSKKGAPTSACGNGILDPGEVCDPAIVVGDAGACPASCSASGCEVATLSGNPLSCTARCVVEPVACAAGDGCCPLGCDNATDAECTNTCGNQVVEGPESCDGDCPTSCDVCAGEALTGDVATCSAQCEVTTSVACVDGDGCCPVGCEAGSDSDCDAGAECGNGAVEPGESCDGNCPTACQPSGACRVAGLVGAAATCNAQCVESQVTSCANGDGCCPSGCSEATDSDCSKECGNGQVDPGETCDGNCPTSCGADACVPSVLRGSASTCNAFCEAGTQITACTNGDGCCPAGCTSAIDNDCTCVPKTCAQLGAQCGAIDNGCGQQIQCATCPNAQLCSQNICVVQGSGSVGSACASDNNCNADLFCDLTLSPPQCTQTCIPILMDTCPAGAYCSGANVNMQFICTRRCNVNGDCLPNQVCDVSPLDANVKICQLPQ